MLHSHSNPQSSDEIAESFLQKSTFFGEGSLPKKSFFFSGQHSKWIHIDSSSDLYDLCQIVHTIQDLSSFSSALVSARDTGFAFRFWTHTPHTHTCTDSISLSLTHTNSHTRTPTRTHTHTLSHPLNKRSGVSIRWSSKNTYAHTCKYTFPPLSFLHTHPHTHQPPRAHTHTCSRWQQELGATFAGAVRKVSLSHTHTHILTHAHTLTHTHCLSENRSWGQHLLVQ